MVYKNKTVKATDLYKWIGKTIGVEDRIVRDVLSCLSDCVGIATSQGYNVSVPRVGLFYAQNKKGYKAGDTHSFGYIGNPEDVVCDNEDYKTEWDEENKKYIRTIKKDQPDYRDVRFRFSPMLKARVKEESKEWLTYQTKNL